MTAPIAIGRAVLDVDACRLRGPGNPRRGVRLDSQVARVLAHLAERHGRVAPLEDVLDAMYAGTYATARDPVAVARVRLSQARKALREAEADAGISSVQGVGPRLDVPARTAPLHIVPRGNAGERHRHLLAERLRGASLDELAERYGYAHARSVTAVLSRARRQARAAEARP